MYLARFDKNAYDTLETLFQHTHALFSYLLVWQTLFQRRIPSIREIISLLGYPLNITNK